MSKSVSNGMNLQLSQFGIFRGGGVAFWGDLTTSNLITQLFLVKFDLLSRVMVKNTVIQDYIYDKEMIMNILNLVKFYKIGGHFVFGFIKKVHFL